jgi:hypothetical protein
MYVLLSLKQKTICTTEWCILHRYQIQAIYIRLSIELINYHNLKQLIMSSSKSSQTPSHDEAWDSIFSLDPTTSPFHPQSNVEHDPTNFTSNLDIFAAQPLFLPGSYLSQPNYYPNQPAPQMQITHMLPYDSASGFDVVHDTVHSGTFDEIRGDLDKVIMSVWQLKNDYQMRIQNLDQLVITVILLV